MMLLHIVAELYNLDLHSSNKRHYTLCPFHSERSPSFVIYEETESYYCFGCGRSGTLTDLILAANDPRYRSFADLRDLPVTYKLVETNTPAKALDLEVVGVRVLPQNKLLQDFGITKVVSGPLRGRYLIPYYKEGMVVCYEARDFSSRLQPKVLTVPTGARIKSVVWNMDRLLPNQELILVEGVKDALFVMKYGYSNVGSIAGSDVSGEQLRILQGLHPKPLVIAFDSDTAGWYGAISIIQRMYSSCEVRLVKLPVNSDPAKVGATTFQHALEGATPITNLQKFVIALNRLRLFGATPKVFTR